MTLYNLEGFEGYTNGQDIDTEIPEWGEHAGRGAPDVEALPILGRQAASYEFGDYMAVQSNADGSAVNQTATFPVYPFADCTIRWSFYSELGRYCDVAWAIPNTSDGFNSDSCYRVRAGTESNQPFLRKTVNGSSTALASFGKLLQRDTYYDFAVEFEETGTEINLSLQIWEYNSGTGSWDDFGSITYTDTDLTLEGNGGIGFALGHLPANEARVDNIRFHDQLGQTAAPEFIPTEFQVSANESISTTTSATTSVNETATATTSVDISFGTDGVVSTGVSETAVATESVDTSTSANVGAGEAARAFESTGVGVTSSVDASASGRAQEQIAASTSSTVETTETANAVESVGVSTSGTVETTDTARAVESVGTSATATPSITDVGRVYESTDVTVTSDSSLSASSKAVESVSVDSSATVSSMSTLSRAKEVVSVSFISDTLITDSSKAVEAVSVSTSASVSIQDKIDVAADRIVSVVGSVNKTFSVSGKVNDVRNADGLWNKLRTVSGIRE